MNQDMVQDREAKTVQTDAAMSYSPAKAAVRKKKKKVYRSISSAGFVLCFCVIVGIVVISCVRFLNLKEVLTTQSEENERLTTQLSRLKSDNDALSENVQNSIDWTYIKDTAINDYGMKYATKDQIVWYHTDGSSGIRQYKEVPSD